MLRTSHFVTSWYAKSSSLGSKSMGGSLVSCSWGGKRVVLSRLHLSICDTTGSTLSPLDRVGDVYVCFPFVHLQKFHMFWALASLVSFRQNSCLAVFTRC